MKSSLQQIFGVREHAAGLLTVAQAMDWTNSYGLHVQNNIWEFFHLHDHNVYFFPNTCRIIANNSIEIIQCETFSENILNIINNARKFSHRILKSVVCKLVMNRVIWSSLVNMEGKGSILTWLPKHYLCTSM